MDRRLRALLGRPVALDIAIAALLAALSLIFTWQMIDPGSSAKELSYTFGLAASLHWHVLIWLLTSGAALTVLPLRRRFPIIVFAVTLTVAIAHSVVLEFSPSPADVAVPIATYTLAAKKPRTGSLSLLAAGMVLAVTADKLALAVAYSDSLRLVKILGGGWLGRPTTAIMLAMVLVAAWFAGDSSRTRQAYLAEVERRAADAIRDRDRQAELAAAAERARLTRELHDVIAHALSVMVIQAQGAASALRLRHREDTDRALDAIVATGRSALAETRRLLGVVKDEAGDEPELAPQPGLADVADLVNRVRQAGTPVELFVEGFQRPLAVGLELSAYRIIQEGLTNTIKHGGSTASAVVRLSFSDTEICVDVTDDGQGSAPCGRGQADEEASHQDATGHGLSGMRARVAMLGGELTAGPIATGGFRVYARLPIQVPGTAAVQDWQDTATPWTLPGRAPSRRHSH
jgi:signal transduction histidine kinase